MSKSKSSFFASTYNLVLMGVFSALIVLMSFTPIGYLKLGVVEISFLTIPVAVCAAYTGKWGGLTIGTFFGLTSFAQCFGFSAFGMAMLSVNWFYCFLVCVVSRSLMGFLTGLIADCLKLTDSAKSKNKWRHIKYLAVCVSAPIMNTLFFCGILALLYGNIPLTIGEAEINVIQAIVIPAFSINGIVEIVAGCVVGSGICEAVYPTYKRARRTK